jgi:hypothetical protein
LSKKLAVLAVALLIIYPLQVSCSEGSGQLSLSFYVNDDLEKALIVGYIGDPSSLSFLNTSDKIYEETTGMLYAVTDSLIEQEGGVWALKLPLEGYYDDYHAIFYIPGSADLKEVDCSQGLEFLASTYNDSLVLNVQGFDLSDPEVCIIFASS